MNEKTQISVKRHIAKSITWRIIATATTISVAWFMTREITVSLKIGLVEVFLKTLIYFIHERIWYKSDFGIKGKRSDSKESESLIYPSGDLTEIPSSALKK